MVAQRVALAASWPFADDAHHKQTLAIPGHRVLAVNQTEILENGSYFRTVVVTRQPFQHAILDNRPLVICTEVYAIEDKSKLEVGVGVSHRTCLQPNASGRLRNHYQFL